MSVLTVRPVFRKLNLTAHVACSVGWLGSVASFFVLSLAGLASRDAQIVRSAYVAMNLIGEFTIVPLGLAALLTGVVQSLVTHWGLFRHYWVLLKFVLTVGASILLVLHQVTAVEVAAKEVAAASMLTRPNVGGLGVQLVGDAGLALLVLLLTTTLSIYKPWGVTPFARAEVELATTKRMAVPIGIVIAVGLILALLVIRHLPIGIGRHGH
jgi:hypothetical protein